MREEDEVKLTYPCDYPIKVMGLQEADFAAAMIAIVQRHDPALREERITYRESRNGKYLAVNFIITATDEAQIQALFDDLKASGRVAMVL